MTVRVRGFWTLLGSAVAGLGLYGLLLHLLPDATGTVRVPFALGLPIVGMVIGLIELTTGMPFAQVNQAWVKLPTWIQVPLGCLIAVVVVLAMFYGTYFLLSR